MPLLRKPEMPGETEHCTFLTQDDLAALVHLSPRTLERHRLNGTGPRFVRMGRRVLYRRVDIDAWASANTFWSTSEALPRIRD